MHSTQQTIETELIARKLRRHEEAKQALSKVSGKHWPVVIGAFPVIIQSLFGKQIQQYLEFSSQATWLAVLTLSAVLYLSWQVVVLRRQVEALHYMLQHPGDA